MAVAMRGELAKTVMVHADRGCRYTRAQLARFARGHNLTRSVGRIGVLLGERYAVSFCATTKVEFYDPILGAHPYRG